MAANLTLIVNNSPNLTPKKPVDLAVLTGGKKDNVFINLLATTRKRNSKKLRALNKLKQNPWGVSKPLEFYKQPGDVPKFFTGIPLAMAVLGLCAGIYFHLTLDIIVFPVMIAFLSYYNWNNYQKELVRRKNKAEYERFLSKLDRIKSTPDDSA
jgi:hypothetical protein